jgi:hypothetical protein
MMKKKIWRKRMSEETKRGREKERWRERKEKERGKKQIYDDHADLLLVVDWVAEQDNRHDDRDALATRCDDVLPPRPMIFLQRDDRDLCEYLEEGSDHDLVEDGAVLLHKGDRLADGAEADHFWCVGDGGRERCVNR